MPYEATTTPSSRTPCRREILAAGIAAVGATTLFPGCRNATDSTNSPAVRTDVPLRLLWLGTQADADIIKRKWEAIAPQPLQISVTPVDRSDCAGIIKTILDQYKSNDLIAYPLLAAAELFAEGAVVHKDDSLLGETSTTAPNEDAPASISRLYPALRNNAAQFAGEATGLPLGAKIPAVLSTDPIEPLASWSDYHTWVAEDLKGQAAEPLAPGWAGQMFLWRASTTVESQWLFAGKEFTPQIDQSEFVDVLKQMVATAKQYKAGPKSPSEIWQSLVDGDVLGGIGWEMPIENDSVEISLSDLPGDSDDGSRLLLDAFTPLISISAGCRQSGASNDFLKWISSGEGNDSLQGQVSVMTPIRINSDSSSTASRSSSRSPYQRWLRKRLQSPLARPNLQLVSGDRYYAALDSQISRCLNGKAKPAEALAEAASVWNELNAEVTTAEQERTWRMAQGSRG
ncbi:hypothetical protein [Planctomycetes bacterium K23_9]|uniref:Bacterial extracellular solute-binding protein n=1 Tax=Stieleria marina TaxID=1930275 RepID=A0A517NQK7_9BACT|nr:hypothetical protein K239x_13490 [Planctomycetes bacterium K23_9]